jgi:hypothetical protein
VSAAQAIALVSPHALAVAACVARLAPVALLCPLLGGQAAGQTVKLSTCLALALGVHFAGGVQAPALDGAWAVAGLLVREAVFGVAWQFREGCNLRVQYFYSGNRSNIDIYDFNRHEVYKGIRCDMN